MRLSALTYTSPIVYSYRFIYNNGYLYIKVVVWIIIPFTGKPFPLFFADDEDIEAPMTCQSPDQITETTNKLIIFAGPRRISQHPTVAKNRDIRKDIPRKSHISQSQEDYDFTNDELPR